MWKNIDGYDGTYQVSDDGQVRNVKTGLTLKQQKTKFGYLAVKLFSHNKGKEYKVHRLVATAFIENPHNKPQVNHIDCDRTNNDVTNLEWVTNKENSQWSIRLGRRVMTEKWRENIIRTRKRKPVRGINLATGEVVLFNGVRETSKIGIDPSGVINCCKGRSDNVGGYTWEYIEAEGEG